MITDEILSVPSVDDAERAAAALEARGARYVLLFGSLARGHASQRSDIDLVAVFDDLGDYSNRCDLRESLMSAAEDASGWPVDILVSDRPEWRARTSMRTSIESHIDETKLVLRDLDPSGPIDWEKQLEMPKTDQEEANEDIGAARSALDRANSLLESSPKERRSIQAGMNHRWDRQRFDRMIDLCAKCHTVVETSVKAYTRGICGKYPDRGRGGHTIEELIEALPNADQQKFHGALSPISPSEFSPWRQAGTYTFAYKSKTALRRVTPRYVYDFFSAAQRCASLVALAMENRYGQDDATTDLLAEVQDQDALAAADDLRVEPHFAESTYEKLQLRPRSDALSAPQPPTLPTEMLVDPDDWRLRLLKLLQRVLRV